MTLLTDAPALAVVGCTRLARWLPDGVDVVAVTAAGRGLAATAGIGDADELGVLPDTMAACHAS